MLRPGDHIWAGVGQSPLLVAHEREDLPSRALRPLRLPDQEKNITQSRQILHYSRENSFWYSSSFGAVLAWRDQ